MPAYTVLEWKALPHGDTEGCIPPGFAGRLAELAKTFSFAGGGGGVIEDRRRELRARGVVGVLALPECSLEILPKIDVGQPDGSPEQNAAIRRRLVHMLAVALDLKIEPGRVTELDWQQETLLEILIRLFCEKLTDAIRRGMPRRYVGHEDDLAALRGSLNVSRQFTRHAVNPSRLACRYDELSEDVALNRIMKAAVLHLSKVSQSSRNRQRLRELGFVYADIADLPASALRWGDVVIDRTNRAWSDLLGLAQLLLRNRYQTTSRGVGQGTALLFEMNALFEEYVGRLVARALAATDFRVTRQGGGKHCLISIEDGRKAFQTKPDILICQEGRVSHVIDTKWKLISSQIDDPKRGVSQGDVYQMMAYAQLYKAPRLTLLYPHHGTADKEGIQARFRILGHETAIETMTLDVADGRDIVARLGTFVLQSSPEEHLATH